LEPGRREEYTRAVSALEGLTALAATVARASPQARGDASCMRHAALPALVWSLQRAGDV
jgi:hypothetical protein